MKFRAISVVALVIGALALSSGPATAESDAVAPEVAYALQAQPGGVAIDYWHAEWPGIGMTLTVPSSSPSPSFSALAAVGACASGRVCAFNGYGATGTFLSWSTCGSHSTTALSGSVRSIGNARSSGTLHARNGTSVVASAAPGKSANVYATVTNIYC